MTVRELRYLGDPVLRTPCEPVTVFDDRLRVLITDLLDTVQLPGRAGLAAPQIGSSVAAFSYNVDGRLGYLINPVIEQAEGHYEGLEGCLSVPGVQADVVRAAHVRIAGLDLHGRRVELAGEGEFARCMQHETAHLAGRLYLDLLPRAERARILAMTASR